MKTAITITDIAGTSGSVTVTERYEVVDAIRGWFDGMGAEIAESLDALDTAICAKGHEVEEYASFLGIEIKYSRID